MTKQTWAWAVAAALCSAAAWATTLLAADVPALTRGADTVVRGTVTKLGSHWTGDHLRIVTEVQIEVAEAYKGAPPPAVTVVQPGGVVGDVGQAVSGLATFSEGEEVVVFLERRPGGSFLVAGMAQGKYRVERSSDGKEAFAVPDDTGDALVLDPVTRAPVSTGKRRPPTLVELVAAVRAAAAAPGSAPGIPARPGSFEKAP